MKYLNKKIYITGGSSGIGLAAAQQFAAQGADVAIFARRQEQLDEALASIKRRAVRDQQQFGAWPLDVADHQATQAVIEQAARDFGSPDIVINSAGIGSANDFTEISAHEFRRVLEVNLLGSRNLTAAVLPNMRPGGRIVLVSSSAGLIGIYGYTAYGASKFGVVGLAEALRMELRRKKIAVSVFCPPEVDTPLIVEERKTLPIETRLVKGMAGRLTPESCARQLIEGIDKGRFMIIPGRMMKMLYYMNRFLPGPVSRATSDAVVSICGLWQKA